MVCVDKITNLEMVQRRKNTLQSQIPFCGFDEELNYFANANKITNACGNCKEKTKQIGMMPLSRSKPVDTLIKT